MTVYSCGLRLQEALFLEVSDIDGKRRMIHVHRGKGAKDRYVPLPESTYALLRRYWLTHRNPRLIFPAVGRGGKDCDVSLARLRCLILNHLKLQISLADLAPIKPKPATPKIACLACGGPPLYLFSFIPGKACRGST